MHQNTHISLSIIRSEDSRKIPSPSAAVRAHSVPDASEGSSFDRFLMDKWGSIVSGRRRIARHERLFREEESLRSMYIIRFGQFKLIRTDFSGQQCVAGFHMPGDWMGLNAISTGRHEFGVVALEDSEVLEIPFDPLQELMRKQAQIQQEIFEVMSEALNSKFNDSIYMGSSLDCRFARFLLRLGEKYSQLGYSKKQYRLSMSRSDIGNFLGSTAESMSRLVGRFNAAGIVTITGRNVNVHDWIALDALSNGAHPNSKEAVIH